MDYLPLNQRSDIEKALTELEKVRVMICLDDYSIIGQMYYQADKRFLDVLNKDLLMDKQRIADFLVVTQGLIISPDGEKEQMTTPCFL